MPPKWHECSGSLGQGHRLQIATVVVADVRERSAENAKAKCNTIYHNPKERCPVLRDVSVCLAGG